MTRQIRVYDETAKLIEEITKRNPGMTFAEVVEGWARILHPGTYKIVMLSSEEIDVALKRDLHEQEKYK